MSDPDQEKTVPVSDLRTLVAEWRNVEGPFSKDQEEAFDRCATELQRVIDDA